MPHGAHARTRGAGSSVRFRDVVSCARCKRSTGALVARWRASERSDAVRKVSTRRNLSRSSWRPFFVHDKEERGDYAVRLKNVSETADYLRLHRATLARWRVEGRGPRYRKHGQRIFYRVADLDAWSDAQERDSTSDPGPESVSAESRRGLREVAGGKSARSHGRRQATAGRQGGAS